MTKPADGAQVELWPALPYEAWKDTCATLHLWTQIVGKIRLAQTPWINHSWHVTLYVTPRGLTTSPIPYDGRAFQIDFDFIDHALLIQTSDGAARRLALEPRSVAEFHDQLMAALAELGIHVRIHGRPNEVADPIPFREDREHAAYDPDARRALLARAPAGGPGVQAVSHALSRQGQPGPLLLGQLRSRGDALFRAQGAAAPGRHSQSAGCGHARSLLARGEQRRVLARRRRDRLPGVLFLRLSDARGLRRGAGPAGGGVLPRAARRVHPALRCRPHCRTAPDAMLLEFLQTTYEAAANAAKWDRAALEYGPEGPRPAP